MAYLGCCFNNCFSVNLFASVRLLVWCYLLFKQQHTCAYSIQVILSRSLFLWITTRGYAIAVFAVFVCFRRHDVFACTCTNYKFMKFFACRV